MKKIIGCAVVVVLLAAVGLAMLFLTGVNEIVKVAIEKFAPLVTRTTVTVGEVDISPFSGKGRIRNIVIGNPEGYKGEYAVRIGEIAVGIEAGSVTEDRIIIYDILLDGMEVNCELNETFTETNLGKIQKNVEEFASVGKKEAADGEKGKDITIERLLVQNTKVRIGFALAGGRGATIGIAPIEMKGIGSEAGASSVYDVVPQVLGMIFASINRAIGKHAGGLENLPGKAREALEGIGRTLGEPGRMVNDLIKGASEGGRDILDAGKTIIDKPKEAVEGVLDGAKKGGKDLIEGGKGFLDGIKKNTIDKVTGDK